MLPALHDKAAADLSAALAQGVKTVSVMAWRGGYHRTRLSPCLAEKVGTSLLLQLTLVEQLVLEPMSAARECTFYKAAYGCRLRVLYGRARLDMTVSCTCGVVCAIYSEISSVRGGVPPAFCGGLRVARNACWRG